ncbi:MAG: tRNA preQ1(34) S-adenosylmethionine ribosyltransferase-isomerase QueA [Thermus sp.]|uniref:tRNA preQ1(34) S-adenosylmethionine ribosyltransferase-isomerase QueA n=1 Tax=unclassified Thermus TaxID=2619321 RepID=UPI0002389F63|nr:MULTISPECIES: tRNA preQ1(34) S-adenosylmethionine ribosyltransferase-isomerase QueA [unclassified Thermus]AEV16135.1 S-adenosylmethionine:tRNA ribosyltransferase-isomerase [Thermus sp. CCB_US3_UF1]MCS6868926.1 tRNA preQ1(34) S-adenosylmethionine ribosyltransferase-isomerase QueA [Thermus sp.]MCS7218793.1 tRNA preQ1(34) S-adenosylmethionine ribosyltransferase-isomerase QueA [Thermus sp.]MDW8017458.1 tRNA preQ1(34) S-adenosylmethionine ribosyltransferase-isomerase QueA [Thermus sp.]MDW8357275
MSLEAYDYPLPPELIAQEGVEPRDLARLMVVHREGPFRAQHARVRDLPLFLRPGDVLVFNESKVIPARLLGQRPTGGKVEVLLVREKAPGLWEALLGPARKAPPGTRLRFLSPKDLRPVADLEAEVVGVEPDGVRLLRFQGDLMAHLEAVGEVPLPPYIKARVPLERYQTVYARRPGSVAAPTAGLHFTPELLERLKAMGVELRFLTLHVGPGTFRPVKGDVEKHEMHAEPFEIPEETALALNRARAEGRRVVAVGTTVVRALESAFREGEGVVPGAGETRLFIRPPYAFRAVDALFTNFHLPRSTLLMLVAAFLGYEKTMAAYRLAVAERYRFYSLGDAMLIL